MWAILTISFLLVDHLILRIAAMFYESARNAASSLALKHSTAIKCSLSSSICYRTVTLAYPVHLRWRPQQQTALVKVRFFRDDGVPVLGGVVPHLGITRPFHTEIVDVRAFRVRVGQRPDQTRGEVLVEE
jgi:hypothetical protein